MGGKTWSRDEERHFWETIVPQSPQAADPANRSLTWKGCAAEMQQLMGDSRRRIYTPTMLYEHYYQNMMSNHTSPRAGEFFPKHKADIARFAEKEAEGERRMQEQDEEEGEGEGEGGEEEGEEVADDDNDGEAGEEEREMQRLRKAEAAGQEELFQAAAAPDRKHRAFTKSYLLAHLRQPPTAATGTRKRGRSPFEDEPAAKRQRGPPPIDYRLRSAHLCPPEAARASNEPGFDTRAISNAGHLPPSNMHPTHAPGSSAFFDLVCNPVDTAAESSGKGRTPLPSERRARDGFPLAQGSSGSSEMTSHSVWNDESKRRGGDYSSHSSNTSSVPQDPENTDTQKAMSYCP
ncbi:hypothetical protein N3K66_006861 [Trichothecium roseum]|uniref:Uncharacterized protein n=1 Tax=Trichothecium roseum TaxID=47278 RepID=A0ACC0UXU2_9HYPO|nr:hypothetical protein N3K66_006861 [Trichothecium roseum]